MCLPHGGKQSILKFALKIQKIQADGHPVWGESGVVLDNQPFYLWNVNIAFIDENHLAFAWAIETTTQGGMSYPMRFLRTDILPEMTGQFWIVPTVVNGQSSADLVQGTDGNLFFVWKDHINHQENPGYSIYAQCMAYSDVGNEENPVPATPSNQLEANYPNPFNPETTIVFHLAKAEHARLEIYNIKGQKIMTLVDDKLPAGRHALQWKGVNDESKPVGSGVYFYRLSTAGKSVTRKMILLK
jgi:hypothetical protein